MTSTRSREVEQLVHRDRQIAHAFPGGVEYRGRHGGGNGALMHLSHAAGADPFQREIGFADELDVDVQNVRVSRHVVIDRAETEESVRMRPKLGRRAELQRRTLRRSVEPVCAQVLVLSRRIQQVRPAIVGVGLVVILCVAGLVQYDRFFINGAIYDPTTSAMVRATGLYK